MLFFFNLEDFAAELRTSENPDKRDKINRYEELFGELRGDIRETYFFKKHLAGFNTENLREIGGDVLPPECLEGDEEGLNTLFALTVGSLSSEYEFVKTGSDVQLLIHVKATGKDGKEQKVSKTLDELYMFQVYRLFEIYVEEQISLSCLEKDEDEGESLSEEFEKCEQVYKDQVRELAKAFVLEKNDPDDEDREENNKYTTMLSFLPKKLRIWLLVNIFISFEVLKEKIMDAYLKAEDESYLSKMADQLILEAQNAKEEHKGDDKEAIRMALLRRTREWADTCGPLTFDEADTLARCWEVPFAYIQSQEATVNVTPEDMMRLVDEELLTESETIKRLFAYVFYMHLLKIQPEPALKQKPAVKSGRKRLLKNQPEPTEVLVNPGKRIYSNNMLIQGGSGTGKTFSVKKLCRRLGLMCVHVHNNTLVQEGIVGPSYDSFFREKYLHGDKDLLPTAFVIEDEIDKVCGNYYGEAILNEKLSVLDRDGEVRFTTETKGGGKEIALPTSRMTFIFTGVFEDVKHNRPVGFSTQPDRESDNCTKEDYEKFGFPAELLGRIGCLVTFPKPTTGSVLKYLSGNDSPVKRYAEMAERLGGKLILTEDGKAALAEKVVNGNTGYRMADSLLDELFQRYLFDPASASGAPLTIDATQVATI